MRLSSATLATVIRVGMVLVLFMPLVVTDTQTAWPFTVAKSSYSRALIHVLTAMWVVLLVADRSYRPPRSRILLMFAVYVAATILAALFGVSITRSIWSNLQRMGGVVDLVHWLFFIAIAVSVFRTQNDWYRLLNWNLVVVLILCFVAVAQRFVVDLPWVADLATASELRLYATLGNASYLATIVLIGIIIATGMLFRSFLPDSPDDGSAGARRPRRRTQESAADRRTRHAWEMTVVLIMRVFWVTIIGLGSWVLLETGTRGAMLGLVVGMASIPIAVFARANRSIVKPVLKVSGVALVVGTVVALFGLTVASSDRLAGLGRISTLTTETAFSARLHAIKAAIPAIGERPILGWGPENFDVPFERHVDISYFDTASETLDRAHGTLTDEFTTKGVVGGIAYVGLWLTAFWAVLRRRRPPRDEILAYAVFGALVAYFAQNQFLFDVPSTLLQWALLLGFAIRLEKPYEPAVVVRPAELTRRERQSAQRRPSVSFTAWPRVLGYAGLVAALVGLLVPAMIFFSAKPYAAAARFAEASDPRAPWSVRLVHAQRSFDIAPNLANGPRKEFYVQLLKGWSDLDEQEEAMARELVRREVPRGRRAEPNDFQTLNRSAALLQRSATSLSDLEKIDPMMEELIERAPNRIQTHVRLAIQALLKQNYSEVIRITDEYTARLPSSAGAFSAFVEQANKGLGIVEPADQVSESALKAVEANVFFDRALAFQAAGRFEEAVQAYDEVLSRTPDNSTAYVNRALAHQGLGNNEQAFADYKEAMQLRPDFAPIYFNRGELFRELGEHGLAISDYDKAIRLDDSRGQAYLSRAVAFLALGRDDKAQADIERALELGVDPGVVSEAMATN